MTSRRLEDPRLIRGEGAYLDDLGGDALHATFVRSSEAHGRIHDLDTSPARAMPGVVGVYTADDLGLDRRMPNMHPSDATLDTVQGYPLASGEVCYVGEPIAVVLATDRYSAADAAGEVQVDYQALPAAVDHVAALAADAPPVHDGSDSNLVTTLTAAYGDVEGAFGVAPHVLEVPLLQHRGAAASIETRGVLAVPGTEPTMWTSTQSPHKVQALVAGYLDEPALRVITPDVGGGFGPKGALYAEEFVVPALARAAGRPVKWVESRREHFMATHQQRDQNYLLEVAFDDEGLLLGLRGRVIHDNGAYVPYGLLLPMTGLNLIPGPYVLPAFEVAIDVVYTNLVPTSPIRGAGRPNAVFAMERCIDAIARKLAIDPVDVRRRNFVAPGSVHTVPLRARNGEMIRYDGGDYGASLEDVLRLADRAGFERRRSEARRRGLRRGIGVASYVEDTGLGPSESARVEIDQNGGVTVYVGVASQGQGHATVFAGIVAAELGLTPGEVKVVSGDTAAHGDGVSTVASRTAVTAAPAVHRSARAVADALRSLASELLEAATEDLVIDGGWVSVRGQPGSGATVADLARMAHGSGRGGELSVRQEIPFGMAAYASGSHAVEVEVDEETGSVRIVAYYVAHDCGTVLNPMIVAGQIEGGVAHGLGNALWECVSHTPEGQPLVTTFVDYRIMSSVDTPLVVQVHAESPSDTNDLGAKGAGEGGTIPAVAAVAAAIEDALSDYGVVIDRYPVRSEAILEAIRAGSPS